MRPYANGENFYNLIHTALPDFTEAEYPLFVQFIESFLAYYEQSRTTREDAVYPEYGESAGVTQSVTTAYGLPGSEIRRLMSYRDVDSSIDEFTSHFMAMFAKNFPQHTYIPPALLVRMLRTFYQSKGTTDAVEWFFRTIFNKAAQVYFPREDILRASDGTWYAPITLKVSAPVDGSDNDNVSSYYVGQRIVSATGSAQVENVTTTILGQAYQQRVVINEITLKYDTILGTFTPGQTVRNIDSDVEVVTTVLPVISSVTVGSGGSEYAIGDLIVFSEGPSAGEGYGALGQVAGVSNSAISGVTVLDGGDGYVTGLPVTFTSTTGTGARGEVESVIYGNLVLENDVDGGYLLSEQQNTNELDYVILEDQNVIIFGLSIEPFVNATATVTIATANYGTSTGVSQLNGISIDSPLETALIAGSTAPFMHPWVIVGANTAVLANSLAVVSPTSANNLFTSASEVIRIAGVTDASTNATSSGAKANVIVSDIFASQDTNRLYLSNLTGGETLDWTGAVIKQSGNGTPLVGTVSVSSTISANVVGVDTNFTETLRPNMHVRFGQGTHAVVQAVTNATFFTTMNPVGAVITANTYAMVPTGSVLEYTLQSQRYYGKIRKVKLLSAGNRYGSVVPVSVSLSAQAQEITVFNGSTFVPADGIGLYEQAVLRANKGTGQVSKVKILNSGVNYTDADAVVITAIHGSGIEGEEAEFSPVFGALTYYPGAFTTSRGFVSADKYLQDSVYYNDYTYVVRVSESFDRYKRLLLHLMHPAGFQALGWYEETQDGTRALDTVSVPSVWTPDVVLYDTITTSTLFAGNRYYVANTAPIRSTVNGSTWTTATTSTGANVAYQASGTAVVHPTTGYMYFPTTGPQFLQYDRETWSVTSAILPQTLYESIDQYQFSEITGITSDANYIYVQAIYEKVPLEVDIFFSTIFAISWDLKTVTEIAPRVELNSTAVFVNIPTLTNRAYRLNGFTLWNNTLWVSGVGSTSSTYTPYNAAFVWSLPIAGGEFTEVTRVGGTATTNTYGSAYLEGRATRLLLAINGATATTNSELRTTTTANTAAWVTGKTVSAGLTNQFIPVYGASATIRVWQKDPASGSQTLILLQSTNDGGAWSNTTTIAASPAITFANRMVLYGTDTYGGLQRGSVSDIYKVTSGGTFSIANSISTLSAPILGVGNAVVYTPK